MRFGEVWNEIGRILEEHGEETAREFLERQEPQTVREIAALSERLHRAVSERKEEREQASVRTEGS